ncbi:hypothetical protein [Blastococcus brunescens]|uniref:magnesium chelatase subunit ChlI family protein n=1 Tax=Blastococcus brunescens TaxID=1564165 RepID=UPI003BEEE47C
MMTVRRDAQVTRGAGQHRRSRGGPARCRQEDCRTGVLRVAWTLADLAGHAVPCADDVAEALGLRLQRAAA